MRRGREEAAAKQKWKKNKVGRVAKERKKREADNGRRGRFVMRCPDGAVEER